MTTLDKIRERLSHYYEPREINQWLESPHLLLAGCRPLDLIKQGEDGRRKVLRVLDQMEDGVYL